MTIFYYYKLRHACCQEFFDFFLNFIAVLLSYTVFLPYFSTERKKSRPLPPAVGIFRRLSSLVKARFKRDFSAPSFTYRLKRRFYRSRFFAAARSKATHRYLNYKYIRSSPRFIVYFQIARKNKNIACNDVSRKRF